MNLVGSRAMRGGGIFGTLALILLLVCLPVVREAFAGAIVTKDRKIALGGVSEEGGAVYLKMAYGKVKYKRSKLLWHTTQKGVNSLFKAGYVAFTQRRVAIAKLLLLKSVKKERKTAAKARLFLNWIKELKLAQRTEDAAWPAPPPMFSPVGMGSGPKGTSPLDLPWEFSGGAGYMSRSGRGQVDEPVGARYSLGMTLWHLGHNPALIKKFHAYLRKRKLKPENLLGKEALAPPETLSHILIEPELLAPAKLGGWSTGGAFLQSHAADAGPTVTIPLNVPRSGLYRVGIRYQGWPGGAALTQLRIYAAGRPGARPMVDDEIYDRPAPKAGLYWHNIMVDFKQGDYLIKLSHKRRWPWHCRGQYQRRMIDCIYLTEQLWAKAPTDASLAKLRAATKVSAWQFTQEIPLAAEQHETWRWWQVRPLSWEDAAAHPQLFSLSHRFWEEEIAALARQSYPIGDKRQLPDYREPRRQVIFNDTWNMVANPVRSRHQIQVLKSDLSKKDSDHLWYWVWPGKFAKVSGWERAGGGLNGGYWDFRGMAEGDLQVPRDGTYHVWIRFQNINYHAHWGCEVKAPSGQKIFFDRNKRLYPNDIEARHAWQKVGALTLTEPGKLHFRIFPMGYMTPATYRKVRALFVTTDPAWQPKGTVSPPYSRQQYLRRARGLGAKPADGYMLNAGVGFWAINQIWWPSGRVRPPNGKALTAPQLSLVMARNTQRSVQLYLRSLSAKPVTIVPQCGKLLGKAGSISWRVVGFAPFGPTRSQWTPFFLLRRPYIKVPPWSVAQVWVTVNTQGVPPGRYSAGITLKSAGLQDRRVRLKLRVSSVKIAPKQPVLVGGYTMPPEGDEYLADYRRHGLNIWYRRPISKKEMVKRGMLLQTIKFIRPDQGQIQSMINRMKKLGLDYKDWMVVVKDEPSGNDANRLRPYIDIAKVTHKLDPKVRISYNPGEPATDITFQILQPYCDIWMPYSHHRVYGPKSHQLQNKRSCIFSKPWLWYTTPCYYDKSPGIAGSMYSQVRSVPGQPGNCLGTTFFALYYPFRDAWDTAYEYLKDTSIFILPSRYGPVATPAWEAIGEAASTANLARMVKEHPNYRKDDHSLVSNGSAAQLIEWLEKAAR